MPRSFLSGFVTRRPLTFFSLHQFLGLGYCCVGAYCVWFVDGYVFRALYCFDVFDLLRNRVEAVDDPYPAFAGHRNSHLSLRHCVHGRGDDGDLEPYAPRKP
jgi:hypothetical protein